MNHECSIIWDLLPLYAEGMVSKETGQFVKDHLTHCTDCQKQYEAFKEPAMAQEPPPKVPLTRLRRRLMAKKLQTILLTAVTVAAVLVCAFAVLDAPDFFPYCENLLTVSENAGSVSVTFSPEVTDYRCQAVPSPEPEAGSHYTIEAWTSPWDSWFSHRGNRTVTIPHEDGLPLSVYYVSSNGTEDTLIYGKDLAPGGGMVTLPRLALGYYLELAAGFFTAMLAVWFFLRKQPVPRLWAERIMLYPVCYGVSHLMVAGFSTVSYSMQRDLSLIILISILLYWASLLLHNLYRLKKEIRDLSGT